METIVNNFTEIEKEAGKIAKSGYEKAIEKGIERGIKRGVEKGVFKEKEQNAIKMLKRNYALIAIQDITGLSLKRINELKKGL